MKLEKFQVLKGTWFPDPLPEDFQFAQPKEMMDLYGLEEGAIKRKMALTVAFLNFVFLSKRQLTGIRKIAKGRRLPVYLGSGWNAPKVQFWRAREHGMIDFIMDDSRVVDELAGGGLPDGTWYHIVSVGYFWLLSEGYIK